MLIEDYILGAFKEYDDDNCDEIYEYCANITEHIFENFTNYRIRQHFGMLDYDLIVDEIVGMYNYYEEELKDEDI